MANGCKLPRNQALFNANKKKAFEATKACCRTKGPKRCINKDTRKPEVLINEVQNKRGLFVVDQKRIRQQERKTALEQGAQALTAMQLMITLPPPPAADHADDAERVSVPDSQPTFNQRNL